MPITCKGTIEGFVGSWGSGIAILAIQRDDGVPDWPFCENSSTVRALDAAFGNVIAPDHCVNNDALKGKRIVYTLDDMGMLACFTPEEEWGGPEIPPEGLED